MVLDWEPITRLRRAGALSPTESLVPLLQSWNDQRGDLEQSGALRAFMQRLTREWSIDSRLFPVTAVISF